MTRELKVMYMWPFKWPQLIDLFTDTAGNKLCMGKKVYLKHLPRRIRMWNVVCKEKEGPENLEKKKTLGGTDRPNNSDVESWTRTQATLVGWGTGLPSSLTKLAPPPPWRSPLTIIFIRRQWIFNLEGSRGGGGGDYLREAIILNISVKGGRLFKGSD